MSSFGAVTRRPRLQEFLGYETPASEVKHWAVLPEPHVSEAYACIAPFLSIQRVPYCQRWVRGRYRLCLGR